MKTTPAFAALLILSSTALAADPEIGATFAEVRAALGLPKGLAKAGTRQLLYFDRGQVEMTDGAVTHVALRSEEAQIAHETKILAAETRARETAELRRTELRAKGEALLAAKLADAHFNAAPLAYQVAYWEKFARTYPGVDCAEPLAIARLRFAEQLEAKRLVAEQAERLAELEAKLAFAEARASYASYGGRGYGRLRRDRHDDEPFTFWPVTYRYYDSPLPYATSPSLPLAQPTGISVDFGCDTRTNHPGRGRGHGHGRSHGRNGRI
jgi:hypothetical protein